MATFNKFNQFVEDLGLAVHNFPSHSLKVALTNVAPVATNSVLADLTQIAAGTGYTTGGNAANYTSWADTSGVAKLILADPATWTGSGGGMGPFRYVVLYNDTTTAATDPLIGWWDYGSSITLAAGETFTADLDATNGVLTIT